LTFKEPLAEQGRPIETAYFVNSGVISVVTDLQDGTVVETGTIGREGFLGLPIVFGAEKSPWRAFCQIPGEAFCMPAEALKAEVARGGTLDRVIRRYAGAAMSLLAQSAACNRAHSLEQRMARWLLMTHDRVEADEFPLTQEFLGQMLGVRRPTVSLAGSALQRAGLIAYSRGRIAIVDRRGLEKVSCECYAYVRQQFDDAFRDRQPAARKSRGQQGAARNSTTKQ
jgi:CRP-like cAMP-binding protein